MNKSYLIGRVTRDLELQHFENKERAYAKFTLAVNEYKSTSRDYETNFINIVAFNKKAEILSQYISKGQKLSVEGKIRTASYLNKDNTKKYILDIVLEDFNFIDNRPNEV